MFEVLKKVRESWNSSEFILLHDNVNQLERVFVVIPSQVVNTNHITIMRKQFGSVIYSTISDTMARHLEIPPLNVMYLGVTSRYRILGNLYANGKLLNKFDETSVSISHYSVTTGTTDKDRAKTISVLGDIADEFKNSRIPKDEIIDQFSENFYIPGHVPLKRGALNLLKSKLSIVELSLALAEVAHENPSTCYVELLGDKGGYLSVKKALKMASDKDWVVIEGSNIINLWRSINKVPKNDIAAPDKLSESL